MKSVKTVIWVLFYSITLCIYAQLTPSVTEENNLDTVSVQTEALRHARNPQRRIETARKLGNWQFIQSVPELISALDDSDRWVQISVISALGNIGDSRAVPHLIQRLRDKGWIYRSAVVTALANIGDESALPSLIQVLLEECDRIDRTSSEIKVKTYLSLDNYSELQIGISIAEFGERAVPYLLPIARDENQSKECRYHIALILARLGHNEAVPLLIDALQNELDGGFRGLAAQYLGSLGDPRAIPHLVRALDDPYYEEMIEVGGIKTYRVRNAAYFALKNLGVRVERNGNSYKVLEK